MGRLAIVSRNRWEHEDFFQNYGVPVDYMGDFSVLGIIVDDCAASIDLLEDQGYSVKRLGSGALIGFDSPASVREIVGLLNDKDIGVEYLDIANQFYQA